VSSFPTVKFICFNFLSSISFALSVYSSDVFYCLKLMDLHV